MDAMRENGLYDEDKFGVTLRIAEVTDRYRNATITHYLKRMKTHQMFQVISVFCKCGD